MKKKMDGRKYAEELRLTKSLLIATSLQKRIDELARRMIEDYAEALDYTPLVDYLIEAQAWQHVAALALKPQLVFSHPALLQAFPLTSLYYRGMAGLSIKACKDYFGAVERIESGTAGVKIPADKALKMARTYNLFISSIILNSTNWTLRNGHRMILATMGITLDGTMRNRAGEIAEDRIRRMILDWLNARSLVKETELAGTAESELSRKVILKNGTVMQFSSEPDIAFLLDDQLLATVEIKGGIDPAGALERYGAAKKSFEEAVRKSGRCRNFYLGGVFTDELTRRITADRLVEKTYSIILLLKDSEIREEFFRELFHHTLRVL
jgi:hypothetical protein